MKVITEVHVLEWACNYRLLHDKVLSEILHNLNECFNDKTKYNNKTVKYASISHASVVIAKQLIEKLASRHL